MSREPLLPRAVRRGATIGIVAPASPPHDDARIDAGITALHRRGYRVVEGEFIRHRDGYLAGSDADRAADLCAMFARPDIDAVMCMRGGYGSMRLLPLIDYRIVRLMPKAFIGYSDITALSLALARRTGLVSFAGPMLAAEWANDSIPVFTERAFRETVEGRRTGISLSGSRVLVNGSAEGMLLGGNLALVHSLLGTPYEPDWRGAVLILEDVGEEVYRIDRMLCHLSLAGVLRAVNAVLLGSFTAIPENSQHRDIDLMLREYLLPLGIPVLSGIPFGHTPRKTTLPIGARVRISTRERTLRFLHPVVRS